jgi:hypothetical protein
VDVDGGNNELSFRSYEMNLEFFFFFFNLMTMLDG